MSKVARIIGVIAAVVAIAATIALTAGLAAPAFATWATIASVASAVSAVAGAVAAATAKPPDAMGTISNVLIGNNMPIVLSMGITFIGGMLVYDDSNGGDNQWRYQVIVTSAAGPIESIESFWADYTEVNIDSGGDFPDEGVTGWYEGWLFIQSRLGERPETAFDGTGPHVLPNWTADHKLSGYSAYRMQMKFDKDGEKFASGVPQWGVIQKGVKIYDPRLDDTYPGGSGDHRFNDESTFEFGAAGVGSVAPGQNPALHALAYARGRFIEKDAVGDPLDVPVKIAGVGLAWEEIKVEDFVELANLCDANGWVIGGAVYEGPGISKWNNLKNILQAAAAEPVWSGGVLSLKWASPKTPVFTITADDLADGDIDLKAMKSWRDRLNTVVPRARLSTHKWEYEQLEAVVGDTYLTEDGESKTKEIQYDLVGSDDAEATADQAAQLAAYDVANSREYGPITIPVKPYYMPYRPGEAGTLDLASITGDEALGTQLVTITGRQVDPSTGSVLLTLESETNDKHAWALGQTGVAPPTPTIVSPEDLDTTVAVLPTVDVTNLIATSWPRDMTLSIDSVGEVIISNHDRVYTDKVVAVTGDTVTPAGPPAAGDLVGVFYDDEARAGGAVTYDYSVIAGGVGEIDHLYASADNPYRHFVALMEVPVSGTSGGGTGAGGGGGTGGPPSGGGTGGGGHEN